MARKRMLDSEIWRDRKVIKLSNEAFILWIAIISMADDEGIFIYDPDAWFYEIARKGITSPKIETAMREIIAQDMVVMYGDGYGFIPAWYKHQTLSHATKSKNKRPPRSIVQQYPDYLAAWVKTFTTYYKNQEGNKETLIPEYPFQENIESIPDGISTFPENSGSFRKTPASIDKVSIDKVSNMGAPQAATTHRKQFIKPTFEEVEAYCKERGRGIDPGSWLSHYEANGWKVGKNPMIDWKAAVRTWEKNEFNGGKAKKPSGAMLDMREG